MHRHPQWVWLSIPLMLLALSAAHAEPVLQVERPSELRVRPLFFEGPARTRSVLSAEGISESQDWRRIRLHKNAGLEVRRELSLGERHIVLGVKGPLMKRKRLGLAFELRF